MDVYCPSTIARDRSVWVCLILCKTLSVKSLITYRNLMIFLLSLCSHSALLLVILYRFVRDGMVRQSQRLFSKLLVLHCHPLRMINDCSY